MPYMPPADWRPTWEAPLVVMIVVVSVVLSAFLFSMLVMLKRHNMLLHAMLPNKVRARGWSMEREGDQGQGQAGSDASPQRRICKGSGGQPRARQLALVNRWQV